MRRAPRVTATAANQPLGRQEEDTTQDTAMLQRILRESPSRFFLGRNSRLVTSGVRRTATGKVVKVTMSCSRFDAPEDNGD